MAAGQFDRLIQLRHRVLTRATESSQEVETWPSGYADVWARKRDEIGREAVAAHQARAENTTTFRIRYRRDVLYTDRIVYDGLSYTINSIAEIGRREWTDLIATADRS